MKKTIFTSLVCWLLLITSSAFAMEWEWLDAMRLSVQQENYRGEFFHRRGDKTSVYSVIHKFENEQPSELLRQLDGDMVEVLREGMRVICYYPEGSESALNHAVPAAPFSQVYELDLNQISQNYQAISVGEERVAGYMARVIVLKSDDWRYSQKLWLEKKTNLLLQSELIDTTGEVLEQFRFTRLELGVLIEDQELIPSLNGTSALQQTGYKEEPSVSNDTGFNSRVNWLPSGFLLSYAQSKYQPGGWSEQRTYSDGLASFSIFVESQDESVLKQSAVAIMGATTALMTSESGAAVTVVGEIPTKTAKKLVMELLVDTNSL